MPVWNQASQGWKPQDDDPRPEVVVDETSSDSAMRESSSRK